MFRTADKIFLIKILHKRDNEYNRESIPAVIGSDCLQCDDVNDCIPHRCESCAQYHERSWKESHLMENQDESKFYRLVIRAYVPSRFLRMGHLFHNPVRLTCF